ncbi:MAG: Gfo/Idh/MocA family protein, partial [Roseimicrobium sp.]
HTGRGNYGHGLDTMWLNLPEVEVAAVADADARGLGLAMQKLKPRKGFADYRQMLAETQPDIVAIGPRHVDQHRDMVLASIEAGAKGLYMEKPFVRTLSEADEVVAACEQRQVKLAVAHRNRYHPAVPVVAQLVNEGAIGRLLEFRARGKEDTRGGALDAWVLGSHLFNLMHFFGGLPLACSAVVLQNGKLATKADVKAGDEGLSPLAGNEVHGRFEMACGVPGFFDSVQGAGVKTAGFGLQLIGTEGVIDLRIDAEPIAHLLQGSPFGPTSTPRSWTPISSAGVGQPEPLADIKSLVGGHLAPARDLFAAMRENRQPLCGPVEARVTVEMISALFESHRVQGARVPLPLKRRTNPIESW